MEYYRITYDNDGIYNALRNTISINEWKQLLLSDNINWLPKPKYYSASNRSYFTKEGFNIFMNKTYPLISQYLNPDKIQICTYNIENNIIVYSDPYQIITE